MFSPKHTRKLLLNFFFVICDNFLTSKQEKIKELSYIILSKNLLKINQ
ncbi:hypothetical protein HMPREF9444_00549 [Succinatimonas hippei YIT 12066]|uniref:Uncharacterized protein n=1 Tax=Succinatimonas hippei (strain DSM 22608 / JCM 16073 / KCTC 15190 / YIT 12066) TaxID=762983 RepID=E8LIJ8_SUCHY|nr:hypothetical protein HMPREF9444_00549 [Succinatimonas hippei YIT 12066]